MPVSSAAIRGPSPSPSNDAAARRSSPRGRGRGRPCSARRRSARAPRASLISPGKTPPRIAPASRMWRTSARVSTPSMPGTPLSRSQSSQPCSAPGRVGAVDRGAHDRGAGVDAVGLHRRRADPVVADVRVGERDQLAREARVAHRLLVARHAGREDDLAGHRAGRPDGVAVEARRRPRAGRRRSRCAQGERPLPVGDRAGGDGGEHPAAQRAPGEAAVLRAARVAGLADLPLRREVDQAQVGRAGRPRSAAAPGRTARRRPTASRPPARAAARPGRTSSVWTAANAVSSPVVPIGASSHGTSFSSRACGAWSVAMQSIVPSRRPSISAWRSASPRSGGFIFSRVSSARRARRRRSARGGAARPRP